MNDPCRNSIETERHYRNMTDEPEVDQAIWNKHFDHALENYMDIINEREEDPAQYFFEAWADIEDKLSKQITPWSANSFGYAVVQLRMKIAEQYADREERLETMVGGCNE